MKILHIIDNWGLGGAQRALSNWVKYEKENEHEIIALFEHGAMDWGDYEVTFLGKSYKHFLRIIRRLRIEISVRRPDVILMHLDGSRFIYALSQIGKKKKNKIIWVEQSGDKLRIQYGLLLGSMLRVYQNYLSKNVDYVVAVSYNIQLLCESLYATEVVKIFNPVDIEKIRLESQLPLNNLPSTYKPSNKVVGFIGRLEEVKGIADLAQIISLIAKNESDAHFWIIGDGKKRNYLENKMREDINLKGKVVFWGLRKDVFTIMEKVNIILMPSHVETFGLVAAEGFTLKKPVIGYAIDGLKEVLDTSELGYKIPFRDVNEMARVAIKVLNTSPQKTNFKNLFDARVISKEFNSLFQKEKKSL